MIGLHVSFFDFASYVLEYTSKLGCFLLFAIAEPNNLTASRPILRRSVTLPRSPARLQGHNLLPQTITTFPVTPSRNQHPSQRDSISEPAAKCKISPCLYRRQIQINDDVWRTQIPRQPNVNLHPHLHACICHLCRPIMEAPASVEYIRHASNGSATSSNRDETCPA